MSLEKAVEAATKRSNYPWSDGGQYTAQDYKNEGAIELANHLLASLPEPRTEAEILEIIMAANKWNNGGMVLPNNARKIISALKSAGVLYCKEGK